MKRGKRQSESSFSKKIFSWGGMKQKKPGDGILGGQLRGTEVRETIGQEKSLKKGVVNGQGDDLNQNLAERSRKKFRKDRGKGAKKKRSRRSNVPFRSGERRGG